MGEEREQALRDDLEKAQYEADYWRRACRDWIARNEKLEKENGRLREQRDEARHLLEVRMRLG